MKYFLLIPLFLLALYSTQAIAGRTFLVSDVDDTLKRTHVLGSMMAGRKRTNNFLGLPFLYREFICSTEAKQSFCHDSLGAVHDGTRWVYYLSAIPESIAFLARDFIYKTKFPVGLVKTKESMFVGSISYKFQALSKLIDGVKDHETDLILIGDNANYDPVAYQQVVQKYKGDLRKISVFIHQVYSTARGAKERGVKLNAGQKPFLTASELSLYFYELGLINGAAVLKISNEVLSALYSKKKTFRTVIPKWVQCQEFIKAYNRPNVRISSKLDSVLNKIETRLTERCYSSDEALFADRD